MSELADLQDWDASVCDGEWEESYGVTIETLDNPGWNIEIDLIGTYLEGIVMAPVQVDRGEHDWLRCNVDDGKFIAFGGPRNLVEIVGHFNSWAESVRKGFGKEAGS
jgi:hypothetical protein